MEQDTPAPGDKKCETCNARLVWAGSGAKMGIDSPEAMRDVIYRCPNNCEMWSYSPSTGRWQRL
jgi:hypothetical protein